MKIIAISDTHTQHNFLELPEGDILIHSGDFTYRGTQQEFNSVNNWLIEQSKVFKHIIFIAGNHDFGLQNGAKELILKPLLVVPNIHYLKDSEIIIEGVKFYGSPWTTKFYNWAFMKEDIDLQEVWDKIPKDTHVLITHGPPHSILDMNLEGESCGSKTLYNTVIRLSELKHHIFGHIHESYGEETIDTTTFHNVSVLNRSYKIANKPTVINI